MAGLDVEVPAHAYVTRYAILRVAAGRSRLKRIPGIALVMGGLLSAPAAAQLSRAEQSIVSGVEANQKRTIKLLQQIVDINSGTLNPAGVRRVYDTLAPRFEALGFTVRYVEQPPEMNRGGHLYATRAGGRGRKLLLIGHLDTVFEEDSPFQRWSLLDDSTGHGPGANDMKGGDVVIWSALEALDAAGVLDGANITVVMTGDEEAPGAPLDVARIEAGLDGLGPAGDASHTVAETVSLGSIERSAKRAAPFSSID